jgi:long-chain acyl-CoA synthetase
MSSSPLAKFLFWEQKNPHQVFLRQPINGVWVDRTYQQAGNEIRRMAAGIESYGYPKGSLIALLSKNCAEWIMADLAIMMAGHISVPIYPTLTAPSIQQILEHSEAKMILLGKLDDYDLQKNGIPNAVVKVGIEAYGVYESNTWEKWLKKFEPIAQPYEWKPDELLTIMYTSGTTGKPKGVMHTVNNIDATVTDATQELGIQLQPVLFSYLPLSHIAERIGIEMMGLYQGGSFSFSESLQTFAQNLAETQPTHFFAVPRIWAKFQEKILVKLPQQKLNRLLSIPIVSTLLKRKIKKQLGLSRANQIFSGAAPISVSLLKWYESIGVQVLQGYGMTEDCIYAHFNRNNENRHGTVGKPLRKLQVKIADNGEIRVKCPALTIGYYKEPELTRELFDDEGYLKTGDKGEISNDSFLTITGRVKDQFKTDKGKYISPAPIEIQLQANSDIEQVCVVGMGVPQPMGLVVLSAAGKAKSKEEITKSLIATLNEINPVLESFEQLEKIVVMKKDWTVENGLMTPTLKVKRNEVEKIHLPTYPEWFNREGKVVWE